MKDQNKYNNKRAEMALQVKRYTTTKHNAQLEIRGKELQRTFSEQHNLNMNPMLGNAVSTLNFLECDKGITAMYNRTMSLFSKDTR